MLHEETLAGGAEDTAVGAGCEHERPVSGSDTTGFADQLAGWFPTQSGQQKRPSRPHFCAKKQIWLQPRVKYMSLRQGPGSLVSAASRVPLPGR